MNELLKIVTFPNDILRQKISDLPNEKIDQYGSLAEQMAELMVVSDGIGLAAVQVGKNIRLAVIHKNVAKTSDHLYLFNPHLSWQSWRKQEDEEGCLSLPGIFGLVRRPVSVVVKFLNALGQPQQLKAGGMFARALQHEIDHLDGMLLIDRTTRLTKGQEQVAEWRRLGLL